MPERRNQSPARETSGSKCQFSIGHIVTQARVERKAVNATSSPPNVCEKSGLTRFSTQVSSRGASPSITPLQILRGTRRSHSPRGAGFQARNADILVGASGRAPILVAACRAVGQASVHAHDPVGQASWPVLSRATAESW